MTLLVEFKWPKARSCSARFEEENEILVSSRGCKFIELLIYHQHSEKVWIIFHRGVRIGGVL
jgi:hypothetical protein